MDANALSAIGLYLTLVGLLGTFYAVQLANWYRDLLTLRSKWDRSDTGTPLEIQIARRDCRLTLRGLYNWVILVVTLILSAFIGFVGYKSYELLKAQPANDKIAASLWQVLLLFLAIYTVLTLFFLIDGYRIGSKLDASMKAANPPVA